MDLNRILIGFVCFLGVSFAASVCLADGDQTPGKSHEAIAQDAITVVVSLAHADARSLGSAIEQLGLPVDVAVASESKLILRGGKDILASIRADIIDKIDRAAMGSERLASAIIQLDRTPDTGLVELVRAAAPGRLTRVAVDETSRLLVLRATQDEIDSARKLISAVSEPPASLTVSCFFLRGDIGGPQENAKALPEKLAAAGRTLQANGFSNLRLISPIIIAVDEGQSFEQQATLQDGGPSEAANGLHFQVKGVARLDSQGEIAQMELAADVHGSYITPNGVKQQTLFEMETTLATKLGDYVVLAASPSSSAGGSAIALVVSVKRN